MVASAVTINVDLSRDSNAILSAHSKAAAPRFIRYVNNRDFGVDPETGPMAGTVATSPWPSRADNDHVQAR